ncbi:iron multicopper oxidase fer1 [Scaptodrosophila lebanonensis]|uniref:Iron multicopper oxidase fer1 n=1 Tax=Drosophila lebanonensis TaxID=7225 RepID=A0A6J2TRA1_DROLE|nr:iron multicopper oxidase fer1 [Scaptodrosophila lebanonensis]
MSRKTTTTTIATATNQQKPHQSVNKHISQSMQHNRKLTAGRLLANIMLLLLQLQFWSHANGLQTEIKPADNTICFYQEHNTTYQKDLGAVWFASSDPCTVYSCAAGVEKEPLAHIVETKVDCNEFYCEVGSELRKPSGSCCGECVRTHCQHNGTLYAVGQSWHNEADCTLLECGRLEGGDIIINTYKRDCPPMPANCPAARIDNSKCCPVCLALPMPRAGEFDDTPAQETWTPEYYRQHPCVRDCQLNAAPMTCHYTFVVEWYQTLSKACFDCPKNLTDCERPHCVIGDGLTRSITVVNRMMPGPSIEVCEGDILVVDVQNNLLGESTTMHWHGLHQRWSPYMDGVPHITQCPISPHSSFRYTFRADNVGTHFWHSHTGMQRGDGVFGALIIRKPKASEPHGGLYDFDLSEHVMVVQDWIHEPGVSIFANHHHSLGDNKPRTLLINGRGRFYNRIWEEAKQQQRKQQRSNGTPSPKTEVEIIQPLDGTERIGLKPDAGATRSARLAKTQATRLLPVTGNGTLPHSRQRRGNLDEVPLAEIPLQVYQVRRGFRYRFRIINAEFLNCPIVVSIDNHPITAINSDGYDFEPVEVGSIVTYAGERFDFVLNANQVVGNYWVRLKGLMDCSELFTSAFQVAILRYEGAPAEEPTAELSYGHKAEGIELNVMNRGPGYPDSLTIAELRALPMYDRVSGIDHDALVPEADYKFFVYYDFYAKDNPEFHPSEYYGIDANMTQQNRLYTPQLNHISLKFPSLALLPARNSVDDALFCNETSLAAQGVDCRKQFCKCHHVLQVPLNAIVEFIIVDEGFTFYANHPFHLHGNAFRVVGLERLGENVTIEMIKQLDQFNLLKRNLVHPPVKDTVTVPDGGYTIIRFEAYNPGFWLFHCHIEFHAEIGMALVLKVGSNDEMAPVPRNFPTCGDYAPDSREESGEVETTTGNNPTSAPPGPGAAVSWTNGSTSLLFGLLALLWNLG